CSCGEQKEKDKDPSVAYPDKGCIDVKKSKTETAYCYDMKISKFTKNFNKVYEEITKEKNYLDEDKWNLIKSGQKSGKITFDSYSYSTQNYVISLNIDASQRKGKILSTAVVSTFEVYSATEEADTHEVLLGAATTAVAAGNYKSEDVDFFKEVYKLAISGNIYYNKVIYSVLSGSTEGEDKNAEDENKNPSSVDTENMTVSFTSTPFDKTKAKDSWEYTDYELYKENKCRFGEHEENKEYIESLKNPTGTDVTSENTSKSK
ncbi:MAG: hypothetical protein ACI4QE_00975, partial [Acutalibacteraceae bacterium]